MLLSGQSPDGRLVEIVELRDHPWFVASQFHPEFKSRPERPHPLFDGFVAAAIAARDGRQPVLAARGVPSRLTVNAALSPDANPQRTDDQVTSQVASPVADSGLHHALAEARPR